MPEDGANSSITRGADEHSEQMPERRIIALATYRDRNRIFAETDPKARDDNNCIRLLLFQTMKI